MNRNRNPVDYSPSHKGPGPGSPLMDRTKDYVPASTGGPATASDEDPATTPETPSTEGPDRDSEGHEITP